MSPCGPFTTPKSNKLTLQKGTLHPHLAPIAHMFQEVGEKMANWLKDEELNEESEDLLIFATIPDGEGDPYIKLTWWNLVS